MTEKWNNSAIGYGLGWGAVGLGCGAVILSTTIGISKLKGPTENDIEMARAMAGYTLQEKDINRNGQVEKFYEINGQKYFSVIDGKDIENSLR